MSQTITEHIASVIINGDRLVSVLLNHDIYPDEINDPLEIEDKNMRDIWRVWQVIMELKNSVKVNPHPGAIEQ